MLEFQEFPKIPRLRRDCVITEKLDGTNAAIRIMEDAHEDDPNRLAFVDGLSVFAQSRSRFVRPGADNFGFASWVAANAPALVALGPGSHFGEWWGAGIQRGYGGAPKTFSLFNVARWRSVVLPAGVSRVPILYEGPFSDEAVASALDCLAKEGSFAAPGFMKPEGVVVYHTASQHIYKVLLENDSQPKGKGG